MDVNTALCLILSALAMAIPPRWPRQIALQRLCGMVLCVLGALLLSESLLMVDWNLDWPALHRWHLSSAAHPGRMAPNASLAFVLAGLVLLLVRRPPPRHRLSRGIHKALGWGVIILGATGLLGYLLRFELLYSWSASTPLAVHTALALTILGIGLVFMVRGPLAPRAAREPDGRDILAIVSGSVTLIAVVIALGAVAFMMNRIERMTTDNLKRQYQDSSHYFTSAILQGITRAGVIAAQREVLTPLRQLQKVPGTVRARAQLAAVAQSELSQGFTWIAFEQNGRRVVEAGSALQQTEMEVALYQRQSRHLIWRDGFYLRLKLPLRDAQGEVGEVQTEQPLDILTSLLASAEEWGETTEMLLCTLNDEPFRCFPSRSRRLPFTLSRQVKDSPTPMAYALEGAGTVSARDLRGQSVIAAYGPIGTSGLGMVLKIDWAELYAPIARQLRYLLVALVLAVIAVRWLVKRRVHPLVQQLVESRATAQLNEARFLSAAESNLDAFYILDSVRSANGELVDFVFSYVNGKGAQLVSITNPSEFAGRRIGELFPPARQPGVFEKYQEVAQGGTTLTEEFPVTGPGLRATWLSQQVVKLGDGIALTVRDISERKSAEEKLQYLAQNDTLTGLPNRALFHDRLIRSLARVKRSDQILALLFMDVDHFKTINDTHGHAAGDEVLRAFAERLSASVRETDTVARLGGDEFTAILENVSNPEDVKTVLARFITSLLAPITLAATQVIITTSIGVALYRKTDGELSAAALLEHADTALYAAKRQGRNGYVFYTALMSQGNKPD